MPTTGNSWRRVCSMASRWRGARETVLSSGDGYPSDLADDQWALVEPLLPPARVGPNGGRREKHPRRRTVDAIFHVVRTGCSWRQLPKNFPPWPTVYWCFTRWHDDGTVERVHDALRGKVREVDGRAVEPSAGLIDSQSVRTADTVPASTRGFDTGKKVKGRKRFPVGRRRSSAVSWRSSARTQGGQRGFQVQPRRWAIERTFAWLTAHRRDPQARPQRSRRSMVWRSA
ncbi:IS5 family transposase [Streptomyces sp. NRRL S-474]|uniref:IS5 family transposase n=2 Tax=unclassified Streptomyces TaxID=2593676 RepID=UPI000997C3F1